MALVLERFEGSGLSWFEARDMDDEALEAALYPAPREAPAEDVDWEKVEKDLSARRGVTLKLLWGEWRETHPDGMSYVTWCRRFREWRPRRGVTMRQNRRPGERLFVDYAGMTVPILLDGIEHEAQVFVASMGVSGTALRRGDAEPEDRGLVRLARALLPGTWAGRRSWSCPTTSSRR